MNLLLDTHVFLWFITGDARLPAAWRLAITDPANQVFLSVVSTWEAAIKFQIGKLPLPESPSLYFPAQRVRHLISSLSLDEQSVARLTSLPPHHRDPFDRILVCQAQAHNLIIVTVDSLIRQYEVAHLA